MTEPSAEALLLARQAAYWAATSALAAWIIGIISLFLTAGGLIFVWRQLKATEVAADAARQASQIAFSAERAWLKIDVEAGFVGLKDGKWWVELEAKVTNIGRLPAIHAYLNCSKTGHPGPPPPGSFGMELWTIWPGETVEKCVVEIFDGPEVPAMWILTIVAGYRLSGDKRWRQTPANLWLKRGRRVPSGYTKFGGDPAFDLDVQRHDDLYGPS